MINIYTNRENYQYDLHSLVKAFYPSEDVKVCPLSERSAPQGDELLVVLDGQRVHFEIAVAGGERKCRDSVIAEDDVHAYKNQCKLALYYFLSEYTGQELPWGNLTGIRPTKLPYMMLREGLDDATIIARLKETHAVSDRKARLSLEIAHREKKILDTIHYQAGYSLYIGIPFCPTTCLYCSFTSYPIAMWRECVQAYLEALYREMRYVAEVYRDKILDSVYIGGGTPTTLEPDQLEWLITRLRDTFDWSHVREFTVEAGRADSITPEKLAVLHRLGVTRISVNPQTMKDETLRLIGRQHTVEQVRTAFHHAREAGFDNINMDIILGLPNESEEDVQHTIDEIIQLAPDSLTVHSLAVKRASHLGDWIAANGIERLHNTDTTMEIAAAGADALGLPPYYLYRQKNMSGNLENVGFAREGKYGIYNILIMEEVQTIVALGAGSITKRVYGDGRIERCDNVKDVAQYIDRIGEMIERKQRLLED